MLRLFALVRTALSHHVENRAFRRARYGQELSWPESVMDGCGIRRNFQCRGRRGRLFNAAISLEISPENFQAKARQGGERSRASMRFRVQSSVLGREERCVEVDCIYAIARVLAVAFVARLFPAQPEGDPRDGLCTVG